MFWLCLRWSEVSGPTVQLSCTCSSLGYPVTSGEDYAQAGFSQLKQRLLIWGSRVRVPVQVCHVWSSCQESRHINVGPPPLQPPTPQRPLFPEEAEYGSPSVTFTDGVYAVLVMGMGTAPTRAGRFRDGRDHLWSNLSTTTEHRRSQRGPTVLSGNTLTHSTHTFHTPGTLVFDNSYLFISFILLGTFHFSVNNLTSVEPSLTKVENEEKQLKTLQKQPNTNPFPL